MVEPIRLNGGFKRAPLSPQEKEKINKDALNTARTLIKELEEQALRPLRAIITNTATEFDINKLATIEAAIAEQRAIINTLV